MKAETWERVSRLLKAGPISNGEAARQLHVSKRTVAAVRDDLGIPAYAVRRGMRWTREDYEALSVALRGGHRRWRGRYSPDGVPMAGKDLTAYRLGFRLHHGRPPVGKVTGTCRLNRCVAGRHLVDSVLRKKPLDLSAFPAEATVKGMDMVAIRRCLRGDPPWPPLDLTEARFAFRFSDPEMTAAELAARLGLTKETIWRYRNKGMPS